jgi:predicted dehydrogenase
MIRGALIGCGFFAVNQMHAWRDVDGASIVAICDTNEERLKALGDQFGIARRYSDARSLFEREKLDFVDVATTVPSHRVLVETAAHYRVPVICQKPFAATLADGKAMVQACASAQVPLMVHENFRWQSPIQAVKQAAVDGEIGEPFWARVSFRSAYDVFSGQPYLATGARFIVEDLGIHCLDIARFLLGDATAVSARINRVNPSIRGEDVATALIDHGEGLSSIVDCSYATILEAEPFPQTLVEVDGIDGTIRLAYGYGMTVTNRSGTRKLSVEPKLQSWASRPWHNIQESVVAIQRHWIECLRDCREPDTSGHDNLKTLALVEGVYASAAQGRTIALAELLK